MCIHFSRVSTMVFHLWPLCTWIRVTPFVTLLHLFPLALYYSKVFSECVIPSSHADATSFIIVHSIIPFSSPSPLKCSHHCKHVLCTYDHASVYMIISIRHFMVCFFVFFKIARPVG
jgi:hypothetical protein